MAKVNVFNGGTVSLGQIPKVIDFIKDTKRYLLIFGAAGLGKSASVYQYAKDNNYHVYTFTGGIMDKSQIYGVDFVDPNQLSTTHYVAQWYKDAMSREGRVIVFLDDLANASPQVANILQQILGDRQLGGHYLSPDKFIIIAATNRAKDNANVQNISTPILNRGCLIEAHLNAQEFLSMALDKFHPSVYSFLEQNPLYISDDPDYQKSSGQKEKDAGLGNIVEGMVRFRPRTWEGVSDILCKQQLNVLSDSNAFIFTEIVNGFIGSGLAPIFISSLNSTLNIPTIKELILANENKEDLAKLIPNNIEAVSTVIFTIYQQIMEAYKEAKTLMDLENSIDIERFTKNNIPLCKYNPLTQLYDLLSNLKDSQFDRGININTTVFTIMSKISGHTHIMNSLTLNMAIPMFVEFQNQNSKADRQLNSLSTNS